MNEERALRHALRSILKEAPGNPDEGRVDQAVVEDAVHSAAQELAMEMALDLVPEFKFKFAKEILLPELQKHLVGMDQYSAPGWSKEILDDYEEYNEAKLDDAFQMCLEKIEGALSLFAKDYASIITSAAHEGK